MKNIGCRVFGLVVLAFAQVQSPHAAENLNKSNDIAVTAKGWESSLTLLSSFALKNSDLSTFTLATHNKKSSPDKTDRVEAIEDSEANRIAQLCGLKIDKDSSQEFIDGQSIVTYLVGPAVEYLADKASSYFIGKFEKELTSTMKSYSDNYSASISPDYFYKTSGVTKELKSDCFRFTRKYSEVSKDKNKGEIIEPEKKTALEFIGQMQLTPSNSAIKIRPLHLAYFQPKAKTDDNTIALSINLKVNSIWITKGSSKSEQTINFNFPTVKIKAKQQNLEDCSTKPSRKAKRKCERSNDTRPYTFNFVKTYPTKDWISSKPLKIIPISDGVTGKGGDVTLSMSIVEAGTPPKYLDDLISLFNDKKDDLQAQLKDAFVSLLPN